MHFSRRQLLNNICTGFGGLAFNALLGNTANAIPLSHTKARAKRVIFLFMHGGPSHVDLFDYKPQLIKDSGKPLPFPERKVQFAARGNLMASPWQFRQVGQSGAWMSELWQHLPKVADE
ncbi:DUF1501 domain-containing protein, partial [bacterium]|nr:DUF1501 domain-containing protein [bacterium]